MAAEPGPGGNGKEDGEMRARLVMALAAAACAALAGRDARAATYNPVRRARTMRLPRNPGTARLQRRRGGRVYPHGRKSLSYGVTDAIGDGIQNGERTSAHYGTETGGLASGASDNDADNLVDSEELFNYGTDPDKEDTEDDGMRDDVEVAYGMNPLVNDAAGHGCGRDAERVGVRLQRVPGDGRAQSGRERRAR